MDMDRFQLLAMRKQKPTTYANQLEDGILGIAIKSGSLVRDWHNYLYTDSELARKEMIDACGELLVNIAEIASGLNIPLNAIAVNGLEVQGCLKSSKVDKEEHIRFLFSMRNTIT